MTSTIVEVGWPLGISLVVMTALAAVVSRTSLLDHHRQIALAAGRAAVQLAAVSLLVAAILDSLPLTALFIAMMYVVATRTAGRRMTRGPSGWWAAVPIAVGTMPVMAGLLAAGVLPLVGIALIPVTGILIGGAMTATALAGIRALDELRTRRGEVEAALALGMTERDSALEICRSAAAQALIPALDQTRTVGLVTLPGAFVGMLLAGASPQAAGAVQLFVLVSLLVVQTVATALTIELVSRGRVLRDSVATA